MRPKSYVTWDVGVNMTLICSKCHQDVMEILGIGVEWDDWLKVMHYLELEVNQGDITNETYESLTNAMLSLKPDVRIEEA